MRSKGQRRVLFDCSLFVFGSCPQYGGRNEQERNIHCAYHQSGKYNLAGTGDMDGERRNPKLPQFPGTGKADGSCDG